MSLTPAKVRGLCSELSNRARSPRCDEQLRLLLDEAVSVLERLAPREEDDPDLFEAVERLRPPLLSEMLLAEVERERRLLPLGHAFARSERAGADRDACTVVVGRDRVLHCFKPRALHEPLTVAPDGEVAQFAARLSEREAQAARGA